jgi:hypothetical protein
MPYVTVLAEMRDVIPFLITTFRLPHLRHRRIMNRP